MVDRFAITRMTFFPLTFLSIFIIGPGLQNRYDLPKTLYLSALGLWAAYSLLVRHLKGERVYLPLFWPVLAYLGVIGLSFTQTVNLYEYTQQAGLDVMGMIFFWYAANVSGGKHSVILMILLCILIIHSVMPNTMGNSGYKAIVLAMGVPLAVYFGFRGTIILSFLKKKVWALGILVLILIAGIALNVSPDMSSLHTRLTWFKNTTAMIVDHPILGVGRGNWPIIYPAYAGVYDDPYLGIHEIDLGPRKKSKLYVNVAHNDWLQITAETGIVGLGAFSWLMWGILRSVVWKDLLSVALWVSALGFLGIALVHFPFQLVVPSMLFWMMSGFLYGRKAL